LPEQLTINVLGQLTAILCAAWSRKAIRHRSCLVFIGASLSEPHLALLLDEICVCRRRALCLVCTNVHALAGPNVHKSVTTVLFPYSSVWKYTYFNLWFTFTSSL